MFVNNNEPDVIYNVVILLIGTYAIVKSNLTRK